MLISCYANKKSSSGLPSWQPSLISFNTSIESGSIIKPCTLKHFQVPILAPGLFENVVWKMAAILSRLQCVQFQSLARACHLAPRTWTGSHFKVPSSMFSWHGTWLFRHRKMSKSEQYTYISFSFENDHCWKGLLWRGVNRLLRWIHPSINQNCIHLNVSGQLKLHIDHLIF